MATDDEYAFVAAIIDKLLTRERQPSMVDPMDPRFEAA
jgi:hypothetical protein